MSTVHTFLVAIHIAVGFASLILFWIPIISRKGSALHIRSGRWYVTTMYIVSISAILLAALVLVDPIATKHPFSELGPEKIAQIARSERQISLFLLAISFLVLSSIRHGLLTLRAKQDHSILRAPSHLLLNAILAILGLSLIFVASGGSQILFYIFAGLCLAIAVGNLTYCLKTDVPRMQWMISHMRAMIGAGIGSYTAFFVVGGSRFLAEILTGQWMLIPWIAPGVIGGIAIGLLSRKYRKKFQAGSIKASY